MLIKKKNRGQIGYEIIFVVGIILLFFTIMFLLIEDKKVEIRRSSSYFEQRDICQQVSTELTNIFSKGKGTIQLVNINNHKIELNGPNQTIWIDDVYPCTMPLKEITNGISNIFTIELQDKIRVEKFNNSVYVNRNCDSATLDFAEDSEHNIITNKIKNTDNAFAQIRISIPEEESFNYSESLAEAGFRMAYLRLNAQCTSSELQRYMNETFRCKDVQGAEAFTTYCDLYKSESAMPDFWNKRLNNYSVIFWENPQIKDPSTEKTKLQDWVSSGNFLFSTDRLLQGNGNIFGINFYKRENAPSNLTATREYYLFPDPLLDLGGTINDRAQFKPNDGNYVVNQSSATNYTLIANFTDSTHAISRWFYSSGTVYFFTSACVYGTSDIYNHGDFSVVLRQTLEKLLSTFFSTWMKSTFKAGFFPGAQSISSITLATNYYVNEISAIKRSSLWNQSSQQWINITDCEEIGNQPLTKEVRICSLKNSTNVNNNIKILTYFRLPIRLPNRFAYIDQQSLRICYNT